MSKIAIIGSGFSGISAAAYLSLAGHQVDVYEKNSTAGGRARQLRTNDGYVFDMGPSWYWMPDIFEKFFSDFGLQAGSLYDLTLLDPSFEIIFGKKDTMLIPASFEQLCDLFDSIEKDSSFQLKKFMEEAKFKYETGMENMVYMPGLSIAEFANLNVLKGALRLQVFSSFSKHVRKYFTHPKLIALMEFPVLFLGAMPQDTPALYSLMNYAGLKLGTWYPKGGFASVVNAMVDVAKLHGARFHFNSPVEKIIVKNDLVTGIRVNGTINICDAVVGAADYHHIEKNLLTESYRNYNEKYWDKKMLAPSSLIYYVGVSKKIHSLQHHNLFFEEELFQHAKEIYKDPQWPSKPLFYACCPSRTDDSVSPSGHENLFLLMPLAPDLEDNENLRDKYFHVMMKRLESHAGESILPYIDFKQSYCISNFIADYNSYKGNAYGLANILSQTAVLKPKIRNKKVANLVYAGQLTVPGPGVPPSIISGKIASDQLLKYLKRSMHEATIR